MVINDTCHFSTHIALLHIKNVMVNQSHFIDVFDGRILLTELIVEVEIVMRDLRVCQVLDDFQVGEEVGAFAVNHGDPLLVQLV